MLQKEKLFLHIFLILQTMDTRHDKYSSPQMSIINIESEQVFLTGSGIGSNEELLEDPKDYIDFFE